VLLVVETAVFLIFGFRLRQGYGETSRFGSGTGLFKPASSPKPRRKSKILAAHRYIISVNALRCQVAFRKNGAILNAPFFYFETDMEEV
jgi:hypothetical protein